MTIHLSDEQCVSGIADIIPKFPVGVPKVEPLFVIIFHSGILAHKGERIAALSLYKV